MTYPSQLSAINQRIFNIGLPVETVSLYLLCCGLLDSGKDISKENILEIWNSSEAALVQGMTELEKKNIIKPFSHGGESEGIYELSDPDHWRNF